MTKVFCRRLALLAALLLPGTMPLMVSALGNNKAGVGDKDAGLDPLAPANKEASAETQRLEKDEELRKFLTTEVHKRLKARLPKVTLTPKLTDEADKQKAEAGSAYYLAEGDLALDEEQLLI